MAELFDVLPNRQYTLGDMLAEVKREVMMRERVYPPRVAQNKMRHSQAIWSINCMKAVQALIEGNIQAARENRTPAQLEATIKTLTEERDALQFALDASGK
jgi:hypothetical protein